jgi:hypothetical protein
MGIALLDTKVAPEEKKDGDYMDMYSIFFVVL